MPAWSSLARHAPLPPALPRPRLLRRCPARTAADDAAIVARAWAAYACGAALCPLIRTVRGPERARVLWRGGSWVVTLHQGHESLTLGPLGLAVPGVAGRADCVELAEAIHDAGLGLVEAMVPELEDVVSAWRSATGQGQAMP